MTEIKKNIKYMFKFPATMTTEEKKEYLNKVEKSVETERFTVLDSSIEVYPTEKVENIPDEKPSEDEKAEDENKTQDATNTDDTPANEQNNDVKVETVTTTPKEEEDTTPLNKNETSEPSV